MVDPVKRTYRSELRSGQAAETRRAVVAAAAALFIERGYGATTVDAVATAAGVSRKTVFSSVGGKADLLKLALDWAIAGDDEPVAVADRKHVNRLLELSDPAALLTGWARLLTEVDVRISQLYRALEIAAEVDRDAADLLAQLHHQRSDDARRIVKRLHELGALTSRHSRAHSVDVAWLAGDPTLFDRLVRIRGWSPKRFAQWLSDFLVGELLRP